MQTVHKLLSRCCARCPDLCARNATHLCPVAMLRSLSTSQHAPRGEGSVGRLYTARKWFAIRKGRQVGIFHTRWDTARQHVSGFSGAEFKSFPSLHEAQAWICPVRRGLNTSQRHSGAFRPQAATKWYAIRKGRQVGIFHTDWDTARQHVDGFSGAEYKGFLSRQEAQAWMSQAGTVHPAPSEDTGETTGQPSGHNLSQPTELPYLLADPAQPLYPNAWHTVEFDGGCRGNPGVIGFGAVVRNQKTGRVVAAGCGALPHGTNNIAEYKAAFLGVHVASALGLQKVVLQGDSQLVVQQLNGQWKVSPQGGLQILHKSVQSKRQGFTDSEVKHVPRERNQAADELSNLAMDLGSLLNADPGTVSALHEELDQGDADPLLVLSEQAGSGSEGAQALVLPPELTQALAKGLVSAGHRNRRQWSSTEPQEVFAGWVFTGTSLAPPLVPPSLPGAGTQGRLSSERAAATTGTSPTQPQEAAAAVAGTGTRRLPKTPKQEDAEPGTLGRPSPPAGARDLAVAVQPKRPGRPRKGTTTEPGRGSGVGQDSRQAEAVTAERVEIPEPVKAQSAGPVKVTGKAGARQGAQPKRPGRPRKTGVDQAMSKQ